MGGRRNRPVDRALFGKRSGRQHPRGGHRASAIPFPPVTPLVSATLVLAARDAGESWAQAPALRVVHPEHHGLHQLDRELVELLVFGKQGQFGGKQLVLKPRASGEGGHAAREAFGIDPVPAPQGGSDDGRLLLRVQPTPLLVHPTMGEHQEGERTNRGMLVADRGDQHSRGSGTVEALEPQDGDHSTGPGQAAQQFLEHLLLGFVGLHQRGGGFGCLFRWGRGRRAGRCPEDRQQEQERERRHVLSVGTGSWES